MALNHIWKFARALIDRNYRVHAFRNLSYYKNMDNVQYLTRKFKYAHGYNLNLENPRTFNEKMQWLKLYYYDPLIPNLVDKSRVKDYVGKKIGSEYLIRTFGEWDSFDQIDFGSLPEKFVLKCTHDSGGLVICKDKLKLDIEKARRKITGCLAHNYYYLNREWPYREIKPRIIAEELLENEDGSALADYKFYCFNGNMKMLMINENVTDHERTTSCFFDRDFNRIQMTWSLIDDPSPKQKPALYDQMVTIAETLSQGFPFVRVDLYICRGRINFGEMTFFDGGGFDKIEPVEMDYTLGSYLDLPEKNSIN